MSTWANQRVAVCVVCINHIRSVPFQYA
jgi:hypothetical protein